MLREEEGEEKENAEKKWKKIWLQDVLNVIKN
jgi:hypothetical protein